MFNKNAFLGFPNNINSLSHGLTADEILFHHHHDHDMLSGHYLAAAGDPPVVDADAFFNQQDVVGGLNGDPSGSVVNSFPRAAAAAKKDRHSKIYTAQGPRDRRVRLSIGVARRFFDLQEILGFDKPSKTLDWLLTKSKTAIKDLLQSSKTNASSASPSEVDSAERSFTADSKRKLVEIVNQKHRDSSKQASDLAKESRVKARARARERTREKMCIKKLNETRNSAPACDHHDLINPSIPIQYMNNQLEFCKISGDDSSSYNKATLHWHPTYQPPNNHEDLIQEESIVIKRKVKHPSSLLGFQQNLFISSSNYAVPSTDNWDISTSFASQSNICAILDQHKIINRYD